MINKTSLSVTLSLLLGIISQTSNASELCIVDSSPCGQKIQVAGVQYQVGWTSGNCSDLGFKPFSTVDISMLSKGDQVGNKFLVGLIQSSPKCEIPSHNRVGVSPPTT